MTEQEIQAGLVEQVNVLLEEAEAELGRELDDEERESIVDEFLAGLDEEDEEEEEDEEDLEDNCGGPGSGIPGPCAGPGEVAEASGNIAVKKATPQELKAVQSYIGKDYEALNKSMRDGTVTPEQQAQIDQIEKLIAKAPPFAEPLQVRRDVKLQPELADKLLSAAEEVAASGSTYFMPSITSTSMREHEFGYTHETEKNVVFRITAKQGLDTSKISTMAESEVILSSNAKYKITKVDRKTGEIHAEQV